jgi:biotin carboxylase
MNPLSDRATGGTDGRATAVVVDGYSAGNFYPAAFAASGTRPIHVQSTADLIPTMLAPDLTAYTENIVLTDPADTAAAVERLRAFAPVCVVAGQESAVPLTDRLSEALGLPGNGSVLSHARRDKYEMTETLRRAGVPCADQFKSSDVAELVDWAENGRTYPVVVKPLSSAATDGVFVCQDAKAVAAAAEVVLASRNIFGDRNDEALIQEYLRGAEYIVDHVSSDGHHFACGVWRYEKRLLPSGRNIYDKDVLLDADSAPVAGLIAYTARVLAALGIRWGPTHAEVIVTPRGPVLVEIGARLNGNLDPGFHDVCLGHNQAALTALACTRPAEFRAGYGGRTYRRLRPAVVYNAPTELDGTVDSVDQAVVDRIRALASVHHVGVKLKPGMRIRPTVDLMTTALRVFLTADSDERLTDDYEAVRALKDSVYGVR